VGSGIITLPNLEPSLRRRLFAFLSAEAFRGFVLIPDFGELRRSGQALKIGRFWPFLGDLGRGK
jgi:hypothetical protein